MQIGDHLVTPRTGYTHHGLYLGNQQVIHYSGKSAHDQGSIQQVSLEEFCDGKACRVRDYSFRVYGRKESVERAHQRLGEANYSILFNNCEQFVAWCIMGFGYSEQLLNNTAIAIKAAPIIKQTIDTFPELTTKIIPAISKDSVSSVIATGLGVTTTATLGGSAASTVAALSGGLSIASVTPLSIPIAVGALVGYGVKRVIDWFDY